MLGGVVVDQAFDAVGLGVDSRRPMPWGQAGVRSARQAVHAASCGLVVHQRLMVCWWTPRRSASLTWV